MGLTAEDTVQVILTISRSVMALKAGNIDSAEDAFILRDGKAISLSR